MRTRAPGWCGSSGGDPFAPGPDVTGPVWFGRSEAPLFGWVDRPARPAVGSAVLCPPLFAHAAPAHHPYRLLARQLVAAGVTVVRFDYEGTGDSAGDLSGPDVVDTWLESVRRAAELARSLAPGPLGLVGLRMGALLAAAAAGRAGGADALVLWDPSVSGRAFLRQQQALHAMRFGKGRADGVVEMPGILLDAAPAAAVAALRLTAEPPSARTLVLLRPDEPLDAVGWLGAGGAGAPGVQVERLNPGEQEGLLEVDPLASEVPWHGIGRVASWLGATLVAVAEAPPGTVPAPPSTPAPWVSTGPVLVDTGAGVEGTRTVVRERAVRLGPLELFGVETGPAGSPRGRSATRRDARRPGPVAVFLSSGADHRTGPSRLWVTLARQWAAAGVRSVRVDLSGLGDSPARPGQAEHVLRPPEAFDDVQDVVAAVAHDASQVILVGLCSGAYQALESAWELAPRGVLGINPALRFTPPELAVAGAISARRRLCVTRSPLTATARSWLPERLGAWVGGMRRWWRQRRPHRDDAWKAELVARGVQVYCVCGEAEAAPLRPTDDDRGRQWAASGCFRVDTIEGLDHALLRAADREIVRLRLTEQLYRLAGVAGRAGAVGSVAVGGEPSWRAGARAAEAP